MISFPLSLSCSISLTPYHCIFFSAPYAVDRTNHEHARRQNQAVEGANERGRGRGVCRILSRYRHREYQVRGGRGVEARGRG